jgi:hypothetical protein
MAAEKPRKRREEGRKTESFTWNKRVWSWLGEQRDAVMVGEEQAVALVVGAKAAAAASRSVRITALMVGVEEAGGEHRCCTPDQVPDRRGGHCGSGLAAWSLFHRWPPRFGGRREGPAWRRLGFEVEEEMWERHREEEEKSEGFYSPYHSLSMDKDHHLLHSPLHRLLHSCVRRHTTGERRRKERRGT